MSLELLLRAAQIIRRQPGCHMAVSALHAHLRGEFGPDAGTYAQVYRLLKNLPHSFIVIDAPQLLPGADIWPAQLREEYDAVLAGEGLGSCARVALADIDAYQLHGGTLALAGQTVSELWAISENDPVLRDYLSAVARQLEEISLAIGDAEAAHPTTHPPDPPQ